MRNCICEDWKLVIGTWNTNIDPLDSSKSINPRYFGKAIYYCPWCGKRLIEEDFNNDK